MPNVLVVGGMLKCSHGGMLTLSSGDARLQVSGAAAVTFGMEVGLSFAAGTPPCTYTTPVGAPSPCSATLPALSGTSALLSVGDIPVLLDNASGLAVNAADPSAQWSVDSAGQTLLDVGR